MNRFCRLGQRVCVAEALARHDQPTSQLAITISTLGSAALFNPLRHRIQNGINRRFYRSRYDGEQIVAAYSAVLRNEVELDKLILAQLSIVKETWQPVYVSFWLYNMPDRLEK